MKQAVGRREGGEGGRHAGIAPLGAAVELLGYPWNSGMKEGHGGFALDGQAVKKNNDC